jgi:hypothetical protein
MPAWVLGYNPGHTLRTASGHHDAATRIQADGIGKFRTTASPRSLPAQAGMVTGMNLLFLSNSARGYYRFFNALAETFKKHGHSVSIAVDCHYSAYINHQENFDAPVSVFSSYFANHALDQSILEEYSEYNLNSTLLPDYERAQIYRTWGRHDERYFDTLKSALLSFFTHLIKNRGINCVIFENVSDTFSYMAYLVCRHNGIRYCGITSSRLPGRFSITENPLDEFLDIENKLHAISSGLCPVPDDVKVWCREYLSNLDRITPDYMKFNKLDSTSLFSRYGMSDRLRVLAGSFRFMFADHKYAFKVGNPLNKRWQIFRRALARNLRVRRMHRYYKMPNAGDRYLLYPLHYHPESSTSVLAGTYLDEYEVIRNIAFNLPEGVRLYVKDHLSGSGQSEDSFYESIVRLPNVRLLPPDLPTKELIRKSLAVITLSSTVGYEALLLGKRVFLYGRVFYEFHPDIVRISNPASLFEIFKEWLDKPLRADGEYNQRFVEAYYLTTAPGILDLAGPDAARLACDVYPALADALGILPT